MIREESLRVESGLPQRASASQAAARRASTHGHGLVIAVVLRDHVR
jgi:hypothetical protein